MSDTIVGEKLVGLHERDAIHCAVAPITASERLKPGTHVSLNEEGQAQNKAPYLGIIDPFLKEQVEKGEQCWLFLYPRTITSLKHNWSHPAFPEKLVNVMARDAAIDYFMALAKDCEIDYDELIEGIQAFIDEGKPMCLGIDTLEYDSEFLFNHYRNLTGIEYHPKGEHSEVFRCAC